MFADLVVTLIENHRKIHLFKVVEIFEDHQIVKFSNIIDLRKLDFLSEEKISECSAL